MKVIEVKDLTFSYDQKDNAVDNVSFGIDEGSYTTIVGHNGSGKSTLAKLIAGLLDKKNGSIYINGLELNLDNLSKIREVLGIVFQNPDNQFIGSTVKDDIAFGLENHLVPQEEMDGIIDEYVKYVGIEEYKEKEPTALSGGQKQRVAIAGALAMKPSIIIFDEATSMLDPKGKDDIKKLIKDLHDNSKFTIVSITHDIEEVLQSDHVIVMNKGKIYKVGTPDDIFSNPSDLRRIGLDIPFNEKVKEAFRNKNIKLKSNTIEEMVRELWQLSSKH